MTEEEMAAVRKCAKWAGWKTVDCFISMPDGQPRGIERHSTHCLLWEACRAKLQAEIEARFQGADLPLRIPWWTLYKRPPGRGEHSALATHTPLENLTALAEVLP